MFTSSLRLWFWADSRFQALVAELDQHFATTASDAHETPVLKQGKNASWDMKTKNSRAAPHSSPQSHSPPSPRAYSSALRYTYNHQIWPKRRKTESIRPTVSLDSWMRLARTAFRSPRRDLHQECASILICCALACTSIHSRLWLAIRSKPITDSPNYYCTTDKSCRAEDCAFVSASGGLARLGLVQKEGVAGTHTG